MKHSQKIRPTYGKLVALLLIVAIFVTAAMFTLTAYLPYSSVIQLVLLVAIVAGAYLLIKHLLTAYEYTLEDGTLTVARGEGVYRRPLAELSEDMICSISNTTVPLGKKFNAYPLFSVKKELIYRICCSDGEKELCIFIAPSDEFLAILKENYPDKFEKEQ